MILNVNPKTFKQVTLGRTVTEDHSFDSLMFQLQEFGQGRPIKMSFRAIGNDPDDVVLYIEDYEQCREWYCMEKLGFKRIKVSIPFLTH